MMSHLSTGGYALVLPGEAMWGAFQTGFAMELGARLQKAGYGNTPFQLTAGSSSGSLVATVAAAGAPFDHDFARAAWIEFGKATRIRPYRQGRKTNPYPEALAQIFKRGLVDTERAFKSTTHLIVTAARYSPDALSDFRNKTLSVLASGARLFLAASSERACEHFWEQAALLLEAGGSLFEPLYFSSKSSPLPNDGVRGKWHIVNGPAELRRAVEASSRIPFLYGEPISDGDSRLIDGVFANNAPVEMALQFGVKHLFVVTSSRKGNVFERPVQSLVRRQFRKMLAGADAASLRLKPLPAGRRFREALSQISSIHDLIPPSAPMDIETLRRRYPGQEIHLIYPDKKVPAVNRFFEGRPEILGALYDSGREAGSKISPW